MTAPTLRSALHDVLSPSRRWTMGYAALALLHGLTYWLVSYLRFPEDPLTLHLSYRQDTDYFPWIRAMAEGRWLETFVLDPSSHAFPTFPLLALLPHALLVALGGWWGFVLTDGLLSLLYYLLVATALRLGRLPTFFAASLSLILTVGLPAKIIDYLWQDASPGTAVMGLFLMLGGLLMWVHRTWSHEPRWIQKIFWSLTIGLLFLLLAGHYNGWYLRLLRPAITDLFFLGWLLSALQLLRAPSTPAYYPAFGLGLCSSLLLQSDFHGAWLTLLWLPVLFLLVLRSTGWFIALRTASVTALTFLLLSIPFFLARIFENPECGIRFGLFSVPRSSPLIIPTSEAPAYFAIFLLSCCLLAAARHAHHHGRKPEATFLVFGSIAALLSLFALPLNCLILGRTLQIHYFVDRVWKTFYYLGLLGGSLALAPLLNQAPPIVTSSRRRPWLGAALVSSLSLAVSLSAALHDTGLRTSQRQDILQTLQPNTYRDDFRALVRELEKPIYSHRPVLGTLDYQVAMWWTLARDGACFNPNPCLTTISDQEIEQRLALLGRELQLSPDEFLRLVQSPDLTICWLMHNKYQASQAHTFQPRANYTPAQQREIQQSSILDCWRILIPQPELERLRDVFTSTASDLFHPPDVLIVHAHPQWSELKPRPDAYRLVYQNPHFRCYLRQ